uniref:Protein kinase domain-containing protein n=1 Tax=Neobodo designis TaxID=312471 RepID=A0A7S1PQC3_NEODS|mmetsp:Transcript_15627/g.48392  ORF Transcript_15627/g.48392 Transcript_15627/m.48392 type:complete len:548 (+) Transcript_15627:127-1770(+)
MVGDDPCLTNYCGTVQYMAPEILRRNATGTVSYGKPVDLWALGVMVFVMLTGEHPFNATGPNGTGGASSPTGSGANALHEHICSGDYSNPRRMSNGAAQRWPHLSSFCKSFLAGLLNVDPTRRLTASEALRHPWVKGALELNTEDRARREWIQEQLDEGFHNGVLDEETLSVIAGDNAAAMTAGASFATAEAAIAASEAARLVAQRSMAGSPTYAAQRRVAVVRKLRAAGIAVRAAHRLIFSQQLRRLDAKPDLQGIPVLRSFRFLVSGRYEPSPASSLSGSGGHGSGEPGGGRLTIAARPTVSFRGNPRAVSLLLSMAESSVTVEVLDLSDVGIDHADTVQRVARVATSHPSLTTLDLSRNPIPPLAGRALVRLARSAVKLRTLHLSETTLAPDTVHAIHQRLAATVSERGAITNGALSPIPRTGPSLGIANGTSASPDRMASPKHGPARALPRQGSAPSNGDGMSGRDGGVSSPPRALQRTPSASASAVSAGVGSANRRSGHTPSTPGPALGSSSPPRPRGHAVTPTPTLPPLHSSPPRVTRRGI